jgi:hypothetical protein
MAKGAAKFFYGMGFEKIGWMFAKSTFELCKDGFFHAAVAGHATVRAFKVFDPNLADLCASLLNQFYSSIQSSRLRAQLLYCGF